MKLKLDEHLPRRLQAALAAAGHDVHTVADEGLSGLDDTELLVRLRNESRALLTLDKRLADVRLHPPAHFAGIILMRIEPTDARTVTRFAQQHLLPMLDRIMNGQLLVITRNGSRYYNSGETGNP